MPRKGEVPKRRPLPDPKYTDAPLDMRRRLTKFINDVMERGKKSTAENIVYGALELLAARAKDDPLKLFDKALANVKPRLEVKSRRVGGSTYQVPVDVRPDRSTALGMRWIINYALARGEKTMREKLAAEILDASAGRGNAVKKREDTHKMAEANKAFAHYRW
jgi:small subunit ribosomal protein S7